MCCLFGLHNYKNTLSRVQKSQLVSELSIAAEARGTDATGVSYNVDGKTVIYKRPLPAHLMWFRIPKDSPVVMGHTRMTTQGNEGFNCNNHPFPGTAGERAFALAHNGTIWNDKLLRTQWGIPAAKVETDSYIAVQMLEQAGGISFDSLGFVAEKLEGSFTLSVLSDRNELFFVKGDNPLCIYHYEKLGLYVYASTEAILKKAVKAVPFKLGHFTKVNLVSGDILKIDEKGERSKSSFDDRKLYSNSWRPFFDFPDLDPIYSDDEYLSDLKAVASSCGYCDEDVDYMLANGFTTDDIEEMLYCG